MTDKTAVDQSISSKLGGSLFLLLLNVVSKAKKKTALCIVLKQPNKKQEKQARLYQKPKPKTTQQKSRKSKHDCIKNQNPNRGGTER
jgi:hypothetical protein